MQLHCTISQVHWNPVSQNLYPSKKLQFPWSVFNNSWISRKPVRSCLWSTRHSDIKLKAGLTRFSYIGLCLYVQNTTGGHIPQALFCWASSPCHLWHMGPSFHSALNWLMCGELKEEISLSHHKDTNIQINITSYSISQQVTKLLFKRHTLYICLYNRPA